MHTYRAIQEGKDGPFQLHKDGQTSFCPKTAIAMPMMTGNHIQGNQQMQMVPSRFPCSTNCPFATVHEKKEIPFTYQGEKGEVGERATGPAYVIKCEGGLENVLPLTEIKKHASNPLIAK